MTRVLAALIARLFAIKKFLILKVREGFYVF